MWEAVEIEGHIGRARDPEKGSVMKVLGTPEIDLRKVFVSIPGEKEMSFLFSYEPKDRNPLDENIFNPNIKLIVESFRATVRQRSGTLKKIQNSSVI